MFKVPFYKLDNYKKIIESEYNKEQTNSWYDISDFLNILTDEFVNQYANIDAQDLSEVNAGQYIQPMVFASKKRSLAEVLIAAKLLFPTMRASEYFLRNRMQGSHTGIDIILPKGTPIQNFAEGIVSRVKQWDSKKKDEGNCVVVKVGEVSYSYSHLDMVNVQVGQKVTVGQELGTCGKTGMSTQYHLHLQIDHPKAPFVPYRSGQSSNVVKYCIDPLKILRAVCNQHQIFVDMPASPEYKQATNALSELGILKSKNNAVSPEEFLKRRQFALVISRLIQKLDLEKNLKIINHDQPKIIDIENVDAELLESVKLLYRYGIINLVKSKFSPYDNITGEQSIALLGRLFRSLKDNEAGLRYQNYVNFFGSKKIIHLPWRYIGFPIIRKEIFLIIRKILKEKGFI